MRWTTSQIIVQLLHCWQLTKQIFPKFSVNFLSTKCRLICVMNVYRCKSRPSSRKWAERTYPTKHSPMHSDRWIEPRLSCSSGLEFGLYRSYSNCAVENSNCFTGNAVLQLSLPSVAPSTKVDGSNNSAIFQECHISMLGTFPQV